MCRGPCKFTKEQLYDLYIIQNKSTYIIAKELNTANAYVGRCLKKFGIPRRKTNEPKINILGQKLGKLLIIENLGRRGGSSLWLCKCECGKCIRRTWASLKANNTQHCGCIGRTKRSNCGNEYIHHSVVSRYRCGAKSRKILFNVDADYLWELFLKQNKTCPYTGTKLKLASSWEECEKGMNASLDRIDSSKGYIKGNLQWVLREVNFAKHTLSHKEFLNLCKMVTKNNSFN